MARTRGGRSGGRSNGRGGGRSGHHQENQNETGYENSYQEDYQNHSQHTEEGIILESPVRNAIANEVYQVIHNTMPDIMAEAIRTITEEVENGKKNRGKDARKKNKEPTNVISSDEEDEESDREVAKGCMYGAFQRCNPPKFDGTKDAVAAQKWIREMNAVIKISNCSEDQKVMYAAHSFVDEALYWWDNIVHVLGERAIKRMKWEELQKLVTDQFCPPHEIDKVEKEFLQLKIGNMTHRQYTTKFNEMARLVPDLVTPEEKRIKRYIQGFPAEIRKHMATSNPSTFQSAVHLSGKLYEEQDEVTKSEPKKNWSNNNDKNGKRFRNDKHWSAEKKIKTEDRTNEKKECRKCGKNHLGECRQGSSLCYKCGKMGHFSYYCPKATCSACGESGHLISHCPNKSSSRGGNEKPSSTKNDDKPKAKARAFNISQKEAKETPYVVSGMIHT